jgi:hypothetical protein
MDTQKQIIEVHYVATQAQKDAAKFAADEMKRTKDMAAAAAKAAKETGEAQKKAAKEATDAKKKAAKETTDAEKRANAERKQNEDLLLKWSAREYKERVNAQIREAKRLAAEEKKAAVEAAKAKEAAAKKAQEQWAAQNEAMVGTIKSIAAMGLGFSTLSAASVVLDTIYERFAKLRQVSLESSQKVLEQALGMRSLSSVMNQTGAPSRTQVAMLGLAAKTGQTPEDAAALMQSALSKGYGAVTAGLISEEELKKAATFQGMRQTLYGESPEALGAILGMLPQMSERKGQTGEEIEALNQRLDEIRKLAGYKNYAQAVGQVERVSPYVLKGIYTGPMAMALTGAMALGGPPEEAGTHLQHATQAVTVGMMRARKMKVLPEDDRQYQTTAEYFRKLKDAGGNAVTDQMPAHERILAVVNDIVKAEDEAVKAGKHFEGTLYLTQQGFINEQHMLALTALAGVHKKGLLMPMIAAGTAPIGPIAPGEGIQAQFVEARRDPAMAELFAQRETDLAEAQVGAQGRFRDVQARMAFNRLGGKGKFGEDVKDILGRTDFDWYEAIWEPRHRVELEAQHKVLGDARAAGVKLDPRLGLGARPGSEVFLGWERLFGIFQQSQGKGGSPLFSPNDAANARNLQRIADNTDRLMGHPGAPPPVGIPTPIVLPPAVPPALPGPAGRAPARAPGAGP